MRGFVRAREESAASAPLYLQINTPESDSFHMLHCIFFVRLIRFIQDTNNIFAIPFWIHTSIDPSHFCVWLRCSRNCISEAWLCEVGSEHAVLGRQCLVVYDKNFQKWAAVRITRLTIMDIYT